MKRYFLRQQAEYMGIRAENNILLYDKIIVITGLICYYDFNKLVS